LDVAGLFALLWVGRQGPVGEPEPVGFVGDVDDPAGVRGAHAVGTRAARAAGAGVVDAASGLDGFGGVLGGGSGGSGQEGRDRFGGDGAGEVVALGPAAAEAAEEAELVGVLDAFGHGFHSEGVGEGDGGADDGGVLAV